MYQKKFLKFVSVIMAFWAVFLSPFYSYADNIDNTDLIAESDFSFADNIVEIAKAEIGFYESGSNKFTNWYYGRDVESSWCCIFVSWCAAEAGVIDSAIPQRASCEAMRTWFKIRNEYYPVESFYIPQKGDIVFYNIDVDGTDNIHHVEIVTEDGYILYDDTLCVKSIGGNTSDLYYRGSQYVMEKYRPVDGPKAQVVGFCHPSYEKGDQIIGKINSYSNETRTDDMRYIHSKYISFISYVENIWFEMFEIFYNLKIF